MKMIPGQDAGAAWNNTVVEQQNNAGAVWKDTAAVWKNAGVGSKNTGII
jgi:hypothetical protein